MAVGTRTGFRCFNVQPLMLNFQREFGAGVGLVEMLFRSNVLAFVGGGPNPVAEREKGPNPFPMMVLQTLWGTVLLWDDLHAQLLGEIVFRTPVLGVRLRRDRLIVVLENYVCVYALYQLRLLEKINTMPNPTGLGVQNRPRGLLTLGVVGVCAVCPLSSKFRVACLGQSVGQVLIKLYDLDKVCKGGLPSHSSHSLPPLSPASCRHC